jgi:hypothetical protein
MHPLTDDSTGPHVDLIIQPRRLEPSATPRIGIDQLGRAAPLIAKPVGTKLESHLAVEGQVGILLGDSEHVALGNWGFLVLRPLFGLSVEYEGSERGSTLLPHGIERHVDGAIPRHRPDRWRCPVAGEPGSSQDLRLVQGEPGYPEAGPESQASGIGASRIGLTSQDPGERDEADKGDEKTPSNGTQQ